MRDFRLANVLTRHGLEGDYVVVDMECAGPDCAEWSLELLDQWNADTLNQVCENFDICHQNSCQPGCMHPWMSLLLLCVKPRHIVWSTQAGA